MTNTSRLGIIIVVITTLVVSLLYGSYRGVRYWYDSRSSKTALVATPTITPDNTGSTATDNDTDTDSDGIPDRFETLYRTDPLNADTDGDGEYDLNEISAGKDPLTPGPNDEVKPLTGSKVQNPQTYTDRYLATLPDDIPREEILSQARLEEFINSNKGEALPNIPTSDIKTSTDSGKQAVSAYLDNISPAHNKELVSVTSDDINKAFEAQLSDPSALKNILASLEKNVATLKTISTPTETRDLHQKYTAASQALADNVKILVNMKDDFVGGLLAAKRIEELGPVFVDLGKQIEALETKYSLK